MDARVLVVDDDTDLLHATSRLLRSAGYEVMEASTGGDGLRLAIEEEPDLVLLDVVLPDINGLEVCRRLKADADLVGSYVVLLSAFQTASDDQANGLEAGADGYIARPIENRELLARVEAMLRLKRAEDALLERTRQLDQRVKELNCLHGIPQLVQRPGISLEEILQGTVELIPPAWQYPEVTCARIILEDQEFRTDRFQETAWRQVCDIEVRGSRAGRLEVYYLEERPELDEGPFLEEEGKLLCVIAERLGKIVERMRTGGALRESEERATAILNATTDTIQLLDRDGSVLAINAVGAERYGKRVDELLGVRIYDLVPPDLAASRRARTEEVVGSGKPVRFEDERDGRVFDNSLYPVFDTQGEVAAIAVYARDITERVQAEAQRDATLQALRESEERFRGIFEQSQDGIALTDEGGLIIEWNQAMEGITGLKAEEMLGKPVWDVQFQVGLEEQKTQEWYQQLKGMILQALESGQAPWLGQLSEYGYQHRDGTRRFMQWLAFPIQTEKGFMMGSIARDITERVRAEEAIRTEKEFSETVFDTVMDTIFVFDPNTGEAIRWNKIFDEISGYTDEEISSKRAPDDWYDEEDLAKTKIETEKLLRGEQSLVEMSLIAKDGRRIPTEYTASVIRDPEGNPRYIVTVGRDIIERKRMEGALRASEQKYRSVVEQSFDGIRLVDREGTIIGWNEACERITGLDRTEVLAKPMWDVLYQLLPDEKKSPSDYERLKGKSLEFIRTDQAAWGDSERLYTIQRPDGTRRFVEDVIFPVEMDEGFLGCGILRDVTERVQAQQALRTSEERYRNLFEQTLIGIISSGRDGRIRAVNPAVIEILGYKDQEELVGQPAETIWFDPADRSKALQVARDLGYLPVQEVRLKRKDGTPVYGLAMATVDQDTDGKFLGITATFTDISELKEAEQALQRSEQRYGRLLETLQEGIWIIDQDARTTFANPRMAEMLGYSVEEMQGKPMFDFTDERGVELCNYYLERRRRGIKEQHDFEFLRKNGDRMHASLGTSPIFDDDGNYAGAIAGVQDIGDRIQTEEVLAETTRLLATIFEHTPMLIAYLDPGFNFVRVNRAYAEADEREPSFFPGKNHFDLYPDPENEEIFRRVVETGQPYVTFASPFEYAEHPERGVSYWDWSLVPIKDVEGTLTGLVLTLANVTEQVQAQKALWSSEQRYRTLFEQTLIGIISSGRDGRISAVNPAVLDILGYEDQEELVGQPGETTWFDPADRSKVMQVVKDFGYHPVTEVRLKRKDGTPVHVLATSVLDQGKDSEFLGVTGMFTDITDRKQAEDKLQWELSVDAALSALYEPLISPLSSIEEISNTILDQVRSLTGSAHGYVSAIDPVTGDNIGYTLTEMLKGNCEVSGDDKRIAFPRGSDGRYPGLWGHSLNTGEAFYTNSPQTHPAYQGAPGGHVPIQQFLSVPVVLGEELVGQIAIGNPGRDYTERDLEAIQRVGEFYALAIQHTRAQTALQQSEEKYRDLVEEVNNVIYVIDTNGVITYVNPAIESFLGYSPSEVVGRPFAQFVAPEDLPRATNSVQQLASGESPGPNEYQALTKLGEVRWMRTSSRLIVEGDQVTGIRGVLTDITDRVRAEKHLEEAAAAAERERLARDLHDAVTQVLFSASLIADTLLRVWERHPEKGRQGLEELRRLTHGALAEMRTLLLELRPGALSEQELGVLLRQLTDGMMARTRMPVATTVVSDRPLPADVQIALYRIAQEALNNIAKHARASRATVSLDNEPDCVTLRISDDGRGFDPDSVQPHQMGMQIMHERAQAIGASFKATSQPGQGTEIVVTWTGDGETKDR